LLGSHGPALAAMAVAAANTAASFAVLSTSLSASGADPPLLLAVSTAALACVAAVEAISASPDESGGPCAIPQA
jgi:hypothetical protein